MLAEHVEGRGYIENMTEAFEGFKKGEHFSGAHIVEYAKKYIALLKQHIDKEDTVLYPMGDARIANEKDKELLAGFSRIENERIGSGKHEQFHAMIDMLKNIYLNWNNTEGIKAGWEYVKAYEKKAIGGTCALWGCVPKKVLISREELANFSQRMAAAGLFSKTTPDGHYDYRWKMEGLNYATLFDKIENSSQLLH